MDRRNYLVLAGGALAVLVLVIILAVHLGSRGTEKAAETVAQENIAAGVAVLEQLEAQDPDVVADEIKQLHQERLMELREERLEQLLADPDSVWSLFEDYVLLGDSRAVGFYYYGFLPESRVLAESGATILRLQEHIPDLEQINPANLFLCYGLNDVSIGIWSTPEEYVEDYAEIIDEIREVLPDVNIYISSILPAQDPAFETASVWREIPEFSAAVEVMCEEKGCVYVDNDSIAEEHADLWEPDGIHVNKAFYPYWAANMMVEVYGAQLDETMS